MLWAGAGKKSRLAFDVTDKRDIYLIVPARSESPGYWSTLVREAALTRSWRFLSGLIGLLRNLDDEIDYLRLVINFSLGYRQCLRIPA